MKRRRWSERDDRELRRLWRAGETVAAIVETTGRSVGSVMRRRHQLGLPPRKPEPPKIDMQLVRQMLDQRKQYPEIIQEIERRGGPTLSRFKLGYYIRAAGWHATGGTRPPGSNWSLYGVGGKKPKESEGSHVVDAK